MFVFFLMADIIENGADGGGMAAMEANLVKYQDRSYRTHAYRRPHTPRLALAASLAGALAVATLGLAACGGGDGAESDAEATSRAATATVSREQVDAALDAADRYFSSGDTAKAEAILLELLKKAPNESGAHEYFARVQLVRADEARQAGDDEAAAAFVDEAYTSFARAAELAPDVAGLQQSAGEIAQAAGETEKALAHYQRAAELDPANPKPPLYAAQVLLTAGRLEEARGAIDRVLSLQPDEPFAIATLAVVQMEAGEAQEALETIEQARSLLPGGDQRALALRVLHARLRRQAGEPQRALELLLPLDDASRADQGVATETAASAVALGDVARAEAAWDHRWQATGDWRAALNAAELCLDAGRDEDAWRWFRHAQRAAPHQDAVTTLHARLIERLEAGGG